MATYQAKVHYTAVAGQTDFDVPFTYIDKAHVAAQVNGAPQTFVWLSDTRIRLNAPTPTGATVTVGRITPTDDPLAVFHNAGTLDGDDLNLAIRQNLFRLQEVNDYLTDIIPALLNLQNGGGGGGGTGGTVAWGQITGKPTFGPLATATAVTPDLFSGVLPVSKGGTGANNADGARANLGLTIGGTIQGHSTVLDLLASLTPSAGRVIEFTGPNAVRLIPTPSGGAGGGSPTLPNFVTDFGGNGDGTTLNDAAFDAAENSAFHRIWIPEGTYRTNRTMSQLTKAYEGPGLILLSDNTALPARFRYWNTPLTLWPTQGTTGWFRGDQSKVEGEYYVIGPGVRESIDARYFESAYIPHHIWMETHSGASGLTAKTTQPIGVGGTRADLNSVQGFQVGKQFVFSSGMDGSVLHTASCDWIDPNGQFIIFSPPAPQSIPTGSAVSIGKRTWSGIEYMRHRNYGGGDAYGSIVRMDQNYQPKAGERHVFNASTVGQYGGDVWFGPGSSGTMATGWESQYHDQGNAVAVFGQVDSFVRNNATSDRGQVWLGTYLKSDGAHPADVAHVVAGKWRIALDTVRADLSEFNAPLDFGNVAINTALGHRWVMNSSFSLAARGGSEDWGVYYGNVMGDMFIESGADAFGDFIQMRFNRPAGQDARLRLRPNGLNLNTQFNVAGGVISQGDLVTGVNSVVSFGSGSGNYLRVIDGDLYYAKGGVLRRVMLQ